MLSRLLKKHNVFKIAASFAGCFMAILFFYFLVIPSSVIAQVAVPDPVSVSTGTDYFGLNPVGQNIGLGTTDIRLTIARIIRIALGMMGIVVVGYMIYGGYLYMTSEGDEAKVTEGKKVIINAVIGVAIILSAFAIVQFVISQLMNAMNGPGGGSGAPQGQLDFNTYSGSGALGRVVRDHYPARDQVGVKRNTKVIITFKLAIDPASFISNTNNTCWPSDLAVSSTLGITSSTPVAIVNNGADGMCRLNKQNQPIPYLGDCRNTGSGNFSWETDCDSLVTSTIEIYPKKYAESPDRGWSKATAMVLYDSENNVYTAVLRPIRALGDDLEEMDYVVRINNTLKRAGVDEGIFKGLRTTYYEWNFKTATDFDITPPYITDVYPRDEKVSRNTIVQINFSEAMDPLTVAGIYNPNGGSFNNTIFNRNGGANDMVGDWQISNGYRTVEFMPSIPCGLNSCGENMYCLPTGCPVSDTACTSSYVGLARTAQLFTTSSFESVPFTGIADVSGNALDGDRDSVADDKPTLSGRWVIAPTEKVADNFFWNFIVENSIDRRSPYLREVEPALDEEDVVSGATTTVNFSMRMFNNSFGQVLLREFASSTRIMTDDIWFYTNSNLVHMYDGVTTTATRIEHREYGPNGIKDFYYFVAVNSAVKALNQNCLYPGRGPESDTEPSLKGSKPLCSVSLQADGSFTTEDCVDVSVASSTDTGCVQTSDIGAVLQPDVNACLNEMQAVSFFN